MKTFETVTDVINSKDCTLHIPNDMEPGRYRVVIVVDEENKEEEFSLSDEQKLELEKRLNRIRTNPHNGYTKEELVERLEARIGRKLQI